MTNFAVEALYNSVMRKLEPTDPAHADVFNALLQQLINNDEFLKQNGGGITKLTPTGDDLKDTTAFQKALDSQSTAGTFVYVAAGDYGLTKELFIKNNTYVFCEPGAVMVRKHTGYMIINGDRAIPAPGPYSGHGNITIKGGVWDANGTVQPGVASVFHFGHAENLTIERVALKDVVGSHHIEFNACKDALVKESRMIGYIGLTGTVESIQLDIAYPTIGGNQVVTLLPADSTPCKNITIDNCYFGDSGTVGSNSLRGGVGGHNAVIGRTFKNIKVKNCIFENIQTYSVRTYNWEIVRVQDNDFINCAAGIIARTVDITDPKDTISVDGGQTGAAEDNSQFIITGNNFYGGGAYYYPIICLGDPTGKIKGVSIANNEVLQSVSLNAPWTGIYLKSVDEAKVSTNTIKGGGGFGIFLTGGCDGIAIGTNVIEEVGIHAIGIEDSKNVSVNGSVIKKIGRSGINISASENITVGTNIITGVNGNPQTGDVDSTVNYIKVSGGSKRVSLVGNVGTKLTGYNVTMGLYVTETCTDVAETGNVFSGTTKLNNAVPTGATI